LPPNSLLSIEKEVVGSITESHINQKYFPNIRLAQALNATTDQNILKDANLVFIALHGIEKKDFLEIKETVTSALYKAGLISK
jgi:glycerol-3-phosphate dehydrogenase